MVALHSEWYFTLYNSLNQRLVKLLIKQVFSMFLVYLSQVVVMFLTSTGLPQRLTLVLKPHCKGVFYLTHQDALKNEKNIK